MLRIIVKSRAGDCEDFTVSENNEVLQEDGALALDDEGNSMTIREFIKDCEGKELTVETVLS